MTEREKLNADADAVRKANVELLTGGIFREFAVEEAPQQIVDRQQLRETSEWAERYGYYRLTEFDQADVRKVFGYRGAVKTAKDIGIMLSKQKLNGERYAKGYEHVVQSISVVKFMAMLGVPRNDLDAYGYDHVRKAKGLLNKLWKLDTVAGLNELNKVLHLCGIAVPKPTRLRAIAKATLWLEKHSPLKDKDVGKAKDKGKGTSKVDSDELTAEELETEKTLGIPLSADVVAKASEAIGIDTLELAITHLSDDAFAELYGKMQEQSKARKRKANITKHMNKPTTKTGRLAIK